MLSMLWMLNSRITATTPLPSPYPKWLPLGSKIALFRLNSLPIHEALYILVVATKMTGNLNTSLKITVPK